jgi:murein DD-endopeptidase MepM/ murein hydrolase activator NlpD
MYKSLDEHGALVFSDLPPAEGRVYEERTIESATIEPLVVTFRRETSGNDITLWADNPCHCVAEVIAQIVTQSNMENSLTVKPGKSNRLVVPARSSLKLLTLTSDSRQAAAQADFRTAWVFGDPDASHAPEQPYRPPFAAAKRFLISQSFPDAQTHATPDSRHAIDIVMPEQTGVFAARGGMVIEVAHNNFRGGEDWGKFGAQANLVRILHDDGSFALYAHLSWDSIRVRPGQRVERGEPIAASGNTGFSTGPHLHFVVVRNAGLRVESVPVTFSAGIGEVVTPQTGQFLLNP